MFLDLMYGQLSGRICTEVTSTALVIFLVHFIPSSRGVYLEQYYRLRKDQEMGNVNLQGENKSRRQVHVNELDLFCLITL